MPRSMIRVPLTATVGLALVIGAAAPRSALGQQPQQGAPQKCLYEAEGHTDASGQPTTRLQSTKLASGKTNVFAGGGVTIYCRAKSMTLISDSAEVFGDLNLVHLIGNVHYTEPRASMDSQQLTYWQNEERLRAEGDVVATLPSGTQMTGPQMDYFRPAPNFRPQARLVAPGRPTVKLVQRDSVTNQPQEPVSVTANLIDQEGDNLVYASGQVDIARSDVEAHADSAEFDNVRQFIRLTRKPMIKGKGDRGFTLWGTIIDLFGQDRNLTRVLAQGKGKAVSGEDTLTADTLDFRMNNRMMQRAYAWGPGRAHVVSPLHDIVSDSLDVRMPDQRIREIRAVRDAYAQTKPDSTVIHTKERDWLRGDTIVARFDSTAAPLKNAAASAKGAASVSDSSRQPEVRQLVALGHARSYYQIAPKDSTALGPAINYVRGRIITVAMEARAVKTVRITDQASGVYVEPAPRDSLAGADQAPGSQSAPASRPAPPRAQPAQRPAVQPARPSRPPQ
jgi:lipopolysaccharide export system protein LptA